MIDTARLEAIGRDSIFGGATPEDPEQESRLREAIERRIEAGDLPPDAVVVGAITGMYVFSASRLEEHRAEIRGMLAELPEEFRQGWSFLNGCMTRDGEHWGEHRSVELLMVLGIALDLAMYCFPRNIWPELPGGVPYFLVALDGIVRAPGMPVSEVTRG